MLKCKLIPPSPRSPFWRIRGGTYPHNGKRIDTTTGTSSKREAEEIFAKFQRDLLNGVLGKVSRTFCEAALSYIEARNPTGSQREAIIGRLRKSDNEISPCLVLDIGERDCRDISQETVNEIKQKRFTTNRHGKPYKPGTIVRELIEPLTAVLNYAHAQDWCDEPHFIRPKFNDSRSEYATREEAERILRAASPANRRWYLFSMLEGTRASETLDLDWRDVYLESSWAVIRDTKDNQEDRGIALHPQIVEMLSRVPEAERTGKVFRTPAGNAYAETDGGGRGKTGWNATKLRAGVERLHFHDIRHTFATLALTSGMQPRFQKEQMGHERDGMYGRYAHVPRNDLINAVAAMPRLDCPEQTYREWAQSGFGRYVAPEAADAEPKEAAAITLSVRPAKRRRAA